jgi:hypothetical protein
MRGSTRPVHPVDNMFLTEAIFELLAEKGILTGEEVLERVKKLKSESPVQLPWTE